MTLMKSVLKGVIVLAVVTAASAGEIPAAIAHPADHLSSSSRPMWCTVLDAMPDFVACDIATTTVCRACGDIFTATVDICHRCDDIDTRPEITEPFDVLAE